MKTLEETIKSIITPNAQTIHEIFNSADRYYIDIYQRDYKWNKMQVDTLLKDFEFNFNLNDRKYTQVKDIKEDVKANFKPYFLNTYLTNYTANHISIVDGQQRLTTILIIFIKLRQLVAEIRKNSDLLVKPISVDVLDKLIYEADDVGEPEYFKIFNKNRQHALKAIFQGDDDNFQPEDETQKKIKENYETISKYYNGFFTSNADNTTIDVQKLTYYIYYILEKINIVEIKIEQRENVSTIFEVVNDRGLGLKSYEILKGKFIGNLNVKFKEIANEIWVRIQNNYYNSQIKNSTENLIDLDTFFKIYFRAKFANSENDYKKFEDKYHYEIYRNSEIFSFFNRLEDNERIFNWVNEDFKYFAELHLKIRTDYENEYLIFNKILDQNQQYLLIISAINKNDSLEKEKINFIAKKFDQLHSTLRFLDEYDSNSFQDIIYKLNHQIRNKTIEEIDSIFDNILIEYLVDAETIEENKYFKTSDLYKWELFKNIKNKWTNFSKYVLMRIDRYLAKELDKPSYCSESLEEIEQRFNKNNMKRYGMHLEHIYAHNDKNKKLFTNEKDFYDESLFNITRNKLGMVLLLKDKQNISSNDDYYNLKIEDYKTSNLIWNELLVGHIDSIDIKNLPPVVNFTKVMPTIEGVFPLEKVETRQKEIFEMIKLIWGF